MTLWSVGDSIVRHVHATLAEGNRAARGGEWHQAAADGDTEERLQKPDRDGT